VSEALRVLRPGGGYAFTVWAKPEEAVGFGIILDAVRKHGNPDVPLPPGPPIFRFSDASECDNVLRSRASGTWTCARSRRSGASAHPECCSTHSSPGRSGRRRCCAPSPPRPWRRSATRSAGRRRIRESRDRGNSHARGSRGGAEAVIPVARRRRGKNMKRPGNGLAIAIEIVEEDGVRVLQIGGNAIQSAMRLDAPDRIELDYVRAIDGLLLLRRTRAHVVELDPVGRIQPHRAWIAFPPICSTRTPSSSTISIAIASPLPGRFMFFRAGGARRGSRLQRRRENRGHGNFHGPVILVFAGDPADRVADRLQGRGGLGAQQRLRPDRPGEECVEQHSGCAEAHRPAGLAHVHVPEARDLRTLSHSLASLNRKIGGPGGRGTSGLPCFRTASRMIPKPTASSGFAQTVNA